MKRRVLIVGASGDIGSAAARRVNHEGYDAIGLDKVLPEDDGLYKDFLTVDLRDAVQIGGVCKEIVRKHSPPLGICILRRYLSDKESGRLYC